MSLVNMHWKLWQIKTIPRMGQPLQYHWSCCLICSPLSGPCATYPRKRLCRRFLRAYAEDRDLAMKILFYARDVRGGLGERRAFRIITRWLADYADTSVVKNISNIPEYGRYDDLLSLFGTNCERGRSCDILRSSGRKT